MSNNLKTFNEWKVCGRFVRKGQKAHSFNAEGKALFEISQTDVKTYHYGGYSSKDPEPETNYYPPDPEPEVVYYADGSGYREGGGPCGPLYFDKFGNT